MLNRLRHILSLSGGKDSTALAIYMRDRVPEMEYVFCDTRKELPETYEFLDRLEAVLGRGIVRLNAERGFDYWLESYGGYLPSAQVRWCTRKLKIEPFEKYVGDEPVLNYIGLRADENRSGYISTKPNITAVYPFKDDGIKKADVIRILTDAGLGLPEYYTWRSRSGCYFCFFQRKIEWIGLMNNHPDLFERAKAYEKSGENSGIQFTWSPSESLSDIEQPDRVQRILQMDEKRRQVEKRPKTLAELFDDDDDDACTICHI